MNRTPTPAQEAHEERRKEKQNERAWLALMLLVAVSLTMLICATLAGIAMKWQPGDKRAEPRHVGWAEVRP